MGVEVFIVGLGSRFQIWDRARWNARRDERRALARQAVRERGEAGRKALLAGRRQGGEGA